MKQILLGGEEGSGSGLLENFTVVELWEQIDLFCDITSPWQPLSYDGISICVWQVITLSSSFRSTVINMYSVFCFKETPMGI